MGGLSIGWRKRGLFRSSKREVISYTDEFPYKKNEGSPWLGLYLGYSEPYERDILESYLSVLDVVKNSPGEKAGFRAGDLIYELPGMENKYALFSDFVNLLKYIKPTDKILFKVLRNLKEKNNIVVKVGNYSAGKEGL